MLPREWAYVHNETQAAPPSSHFSSLLSAHLATPCPPSHHPVQPHAWSHPASSPLPPPHPVQPHDCQPHHALLATVHHHVDRAVGTARACRGEDGLA